MDTESHVVGNTAYFIPLENYFLLGVLSSWLMWFIISRTCQPLRLRGGRWQYRLFTQFMGRLPIPTALPKDEQDQIAELAKLCNALGPQINAAECELIATLRSDLLDGVDVPQALERWWELEIDKFADVVQARTKKPLIHATIRRWTDVLSDAKKKRVSLVGPLKAAESELNDRVERAFGLTAEERRLVEEAVAS